jgi:hypothetical protein
LGAHGEISRSYDAGAGGSDQLGGANPQGGRSVGALWGLLLNVLNIRLGTWTRNPRAMFDENERRRTLFSPAYLMREWFGTNDETDAALFVSDGGHDDNLGLSALVERCCTVVVVLDAGHDPRMSFRDLRRSLEVLAPGWEVAGEEIWQTLIPKTRRAGECCRIPHGVIEFALRQRATGRICTVVYAKSVLTDRILQSTEVLAYLDACPAFPHETTGDQWFGREQQSAYVALGEVLAADVAALLQQRLSSPAA